MAGIRAYEKAGFHTAGRLREAGYWLGEVCDEVAMDALATGFIGPSVIKSVFAEEVRSEPDM